jgi:hypothetical protein
MDTPLKDIPKKALNAMIYGRKLKRYQILFSAYQATAFVLPAIDKALERA